MELGVRGVGAEKNNKKGKKIKTKLNAGLIDKHIHTGAQKID